MNDLPHDNRDSRSSSELLDGVARLTFAAVPVWLTLSFVTTASAPVELRAMVGLVALVSMIRPAEGLCVVAATVPLGDLIAIALDSSPVHLTEALVVAFLAGWLISPTYRPDRGPAPNATVRYAGLTLSALIVASVATLALQTTAHVPAASTGFPGILHDYFTPGPDAFGAVAGGRLIEGLGLSAAVVLLLRRRPMLAVWIPEALGAGCVAAVVAAYSLWHGYGFGAVLARHALLGDRVVAHVADVNAAASYFAMMGCLALGMIAREGGLARVWWLVVAGCAVEGLWLSGSRSANGALALTAMAAAIWMIRLRWGKAVRYSVLAAVVTALVAAAGIRAVGIGADATKRGAGLRLQFTESSYRMIRSHPWLGIGIGQYYQSSPMFLNAPIAWAYGSENAHDYFLQIAAELGLFGFAACAGLMIGALWPALRGMVRAPDNHRLLGLVAGVTVFLLTCATGHPFLAPEVAFPFWLAAGLMVALGAPDECHGTGHRFRRFRRFRRFQRFQRPQGAPGAHGLTAHLLAPAICGLALAVSVPLRAREAPLGPRRALPVEGLFDWETGADGRSYRWTGEYASVFVGRDARRVEIPVRAPGEEGSGELAMDVSVDGSRPVHLPIARGWASVTVDLPFTPAIVSARRINIRSSGVRSLADGRTVGLQIGAPKVLEP